MKDIKLYIYKNCSTCKKACLFLKKLEIHIETIPIRETPPSMKELEQMLNTYNGELKKLFNTSGRDYRELNLKEKLPHLSNTEALKLLSENGNLIKRPFLITKKSGLVGFKETNWKNFTFD